MRRAALVVLNDQDVTLNYLMKGEAALRQDCVKKTDEETPDQSKDEQAEASE